MISQRCVHDFTRSSDGKGPRAPSRGFGVGVESGEREATITTQSGFRLIPYFMSELTEALFNMLNSDKKDSHYRSSMSLKWNFCGRLWENYLNLWSNEKWLILSFYCQSSDKTIMLSDWKKCLAFYRRILINQNEKRSGKGKSVKDMKKS